MKRLPFLLALLGLAGCLDRSPVAPLTSPQPSLSEASAERVGEAKPESFSIATSGLMAQHLSTDLTAENLAQTLVGSGVTISNVVYTGAPTAASTFAGGTGIIGFEDGIVLGSGQVADVHGPNDVDGVSTAHGTAGDAELATLTGGTSYDAAILQFDFVPSGDKVYIEYVLGSDEYNEYANSSFEDAFAFFVNGQNCAVLPSGQHVSINTINLSVNPSLYRNNDDAARGDINTEMDGLTTVLVCEASVISGQTNTMRLSVSDISDQILDTNVFIKAGSFSTTAPSAGTITGVVTDSETQALLSGVQVSLVNSTLSAVTDANGAYSIANVPVGTYSVQAAKQYFGTGSLTGVAVLEGGTATADFALLATHRAVTVNVSADSRCDMTVTARSITTDAFFVQRAAPHATSSAQCPASATFILPARLQYVFGLHNEIVTDAADHKVWPNFRPLPADDNLPNRVGAVCVESNGACTNAALTPDNVYAAIAAATPLASDRNISLGFHADVQAVVPCTLTGASYPARVHVISALDPSKLGTMPRNDFYPPGIGHFVDAVNSDAAGECQIKSVPAGHTVVVEAQDADGDVYRAVLTPGETSLVMEEDPDFFYAYYLLDGYGDNASGKDDVTLVTFGTNRNADGTQGNTLMVKADSRAIQENGTAQFHVEVKDARDASGAVIVPSILAKVICSKQKGTCELAEVTGDPARFLGVTGHLDSAGDGWVTVQFDVSGAVSAEVMVRAGVADGYDFAPNSGSNAAAPALPEIRNGYAVWHRTTLPGQSYDVAYP